MLGLPILSATSSLSVVMWAMLPGLHWLCGAKVEEHLGVVVWSPDFGVSNSKSLISEPFASSTPPEITGWVIRSTSLCVSSEFLVTLWLTLLTVPWYSGLVNLEASLDRAPCSPCSDSPEEPSSRCLQASSLCHPGHLHSQADKHLCTFFVQVGVNTCVITVS